MAEITPVICILPMSKEEFKGRTAEEVQSQFFLTELPSREGGRYYYRTAGLDAEPGTIVLFQYDKRIIASAVFERCERFEQPDDLYYGSLNFDIDSIRVFDPVGQDLMREVWPERFDRFSNAKLRLNAEAFPEFERRLTGIKLPPLPTPQVHDLEAPSAARVQTTVSRIIRDTQLSRRVKLLHEYKCQILTCEYTIVLADGSHYSEGHHVQPLGEPHNGPDILENIVCLCPNHHAACDLGAIRLASVELRQVVGHAVGQKFLDYHNQTISKVFQGRENELTRADEYIARGIAEIKGESHSEMPFHQVAKLYKLPLVEVVCNIRDFANKAYKSEFMSFLDNVKDINFESKKEGVSSVG